MWVRGLKLQDGEKIPEVDRVAPYVGAWIETSNLNWIISVCNVAPYVGAWIETSDVLGNLWYNSSRTLCGCVD